MHLIISFGQHDTRILRNICTLKNQCLCCTNDRTLHYEKLSG